MLRVFCPTCKTPFDVDQALIGQKGLCPTCGAKFIISRQESLLVKEEVVQPMPEAADAEPAPKQAVVEAATNLEATAEPSRPAAAARPSLLSLGVALVTAATTGGVFWALENAKIPESKWLTFAGEVHPMLVHFPAALIPALAVLQLCGGKEAAGRASRVLLWFNFLACCLAILAGQVSGSDRGLSEDLRLHTILGLATSGLSFVMLAFHILGVRPLFLMNLFLALGAVMATGHFGANMSHGDLMKKLPWVVAEKATGTTKSLPAPGATPSPSALPPSIDKSSPVVAAANKSTVVDQIILPILQARCVSCHGADKAKGDLRLDTYQAMMLAGETGKPSFLPGNPQQSESLLRVLLPLEHEDHMPPSKKPQTTPAEQEVLTWWVQNGANATLAVDDLGIPGGMAEKMRTVVAALPKTK